MSPLYSSAKRERENRRAAKRIAKEARRRERKAAPPDQFPSLWPDAPADVADVARTLSRVGAGQP